MTNRQTFRLALKIKRYAVESQLFGFKEHDSYCIRSSFTQGGSYA